MIPQGSKGDLTPGRKSFATAGGWACRHAEPTRRAARDQTGSKLSFTSAPKSRPQPLPEAATAPSRACAALASDARARAQNPKEPVRTPTNSAPVAAPEHSQSRPAGGTARALPASFGPGRAAASSPPQPEQLQGSERGPGALGAAAPTARATRQQPRHENPAADSRQPNGTQSCTARKACFAAPR
eukprot:361689-Chlamydomonas_euryale.AAC.21